MNYLVYRTPNETKRILLDEIQTLIVDSTAVAITTALLSQLMKKKINVIFCDEKHNPESQLYCLYGSCDASQSVKSQVNWKDQTKDLVWQAIVKQKIRWQGRTLMKYEPEDDFLMGYIDNVEPGDVTNREGHAAKYYFNRIFYEGFTRDDDCDMNAFLNYGYAMLLSEVNRAVVSRGYLTQIGIHHKNQFNPFNLSCDLMEPFRPIIDDYAHQLTKENFKEQFPYLFQKTLIINGTQQSMINAIGIYVSSVLKSLDMDDPSCLQFYESYEL